MTRCEFNEGFSVFSPVSVCALGSTLESRFTISLRDRFLRLNLSGILLQVCLTARLPEGVKVSGEECERGFFGHAARGLPPFRINPSRFFRDAGRRFAPGMK